ncbi:cobalt-precorrin-6A reductase, partial [Sulfitobacter pontiacus]|uniref:cobalt-precorrin-6A reductase n=1 Tax=Sulfitobacter pontiacus TaxID=60137 RepID=UPI0032970A7E
MTHVLLLGGTTEASQLARTLAETWVGAGRRAVFSYAGRTARPAAQPLPQRLGGFGGVAGLVDYLRSEGITHVVDATHPFAAQMSTNAVAACMEAGVPLAALERAPWQAGAGDRWTHVPDMAGAVAALPKAGARVFLAIGKQSLEVFAAKPQNHYLLRLVDAPTQVLPLPHTSVVIARGPFDTAGDQTLMKGH